MKISRDEKRRSESLIRSILKERSEELIKGKAEVLSEITYGNAKYEEFQDMIDRQKAGEDVPEEELNRGLSLLERDMEGLGYESMGDTRNGVAVFEKYSDKSRWQEGGKVNVVVFDLFDVSGVVASIKTYTDDQSYDVMSYNAILRGSEPDLVPIASDAKIFDTVRGAVDFVVKHEGHFDEEKYTKPGEAPGQMELPLESNSLKGLLLNESREDWEGYGFGSSDMTVVINSFERMVNGGVNPMDAATELSYEYPVEPLHILNAAARHGIIDNAEMYQDMQKNSEKYSDFVAPLSDEELAQRQAQNDADVAKGPKKVMMYDWEPNPETGEPELVKVGESEMTTLPMKYGKGGATVGESKKLGESEEFDHDVPPDENGYHPDYGHLVLFELEPHHGSYIVTSPAIEGDALLEEHDVEDMFGEDGIRRGYAYLSDEYLVHIESQEIYSQTGGHVYESKKLGENSNVRELLGKTVVVKSGYESVHGGDPSRERTGIVDELCPGCEEGDMIVKFEDEPNAGYWVYEDEVVSVLNNPVDQETVKADRSQREMDSELFNPKNWKLDDDYYNESKKLGENKGPFYTVQPDRSGAGFDVIHSTAAGTETHGGGQVIKSFPTEEEANDFADQLSKDEPDAQITNVDVDPYTRMMGESKIGNIERQKGK